MSDVQDAVRWLARGVTMILERANLTPYASKELDDCARAMYARILDEADSAMSRGERWSATVGTFSVTLTPTR
ncbi:hypothetical protein [Streptomyces sp. NPDC059744]|uniref:hypothetical protein n=1 Tax=Streptomyces sp. NPDC059744 TaxID=3346929 RepID=UPI00366A281D